MAVLEREEDTTPRCRYCGRRGSHTTCHPCAELLLTPSGTWGDRRYIDTLDWCATPDDCEVMARLRDAGIEP